MKVMRWIWPVMLLCACALPPAPPAASPAAQAMHKINLDLSAIDDNGLIGPADGKRNVAYEFCIPRDEAKKAEVLEIDPSLKFYTSPGRIRCTKDEWLVIGEGGTKDTLLALAQIPYIARIDPFYGE
jgi:hypothetical protein